MPSHLKAETQQYIHNQILLVELKWRVHREFNSGKRHLDVYYNNQSETLF